MDREDIIRLAETNDDDLLLKFPRASYHLNRAQLRKLKEEAKELLSKELPSKEEVIRSIEIEKLKNEKSQSDKIVKILTDQIHSLEREKLAILQIKETPQSMVITRPTSTMKVSAVPFIVASDWHIDEIVHPSKINFMNEFNLSIADQRIQNFFTNSVRLINKEAKDTNLDKGVIAMLGDFISGNIHEELMENTSLRPAEAMIWVTDRIVAGLRYILENTTLDYTIVCHVGNHTRITKKVHYSTEQGNSLEYIMYHYIKNVFKDEPRLQWIIAEGYHTYLELYGKTIRLHHGHSIKYGGGVGGIFVPARRAIMQWNRARTSHLDIFGHFHQLKNGGNFILNGSLIGYNAYAINIQSDYEVPRQKFFMFSDTGEVIAEYPIFL